MNTYAMYLFQFFILINKYEVVTILFLLEHYGVWSVELMIGGEGGGVWSVELMIGGGGGGVWSVELMIGGGGVYGV